MKLADLIDRLIEIQNSYDCSDVDVEIMQEHMVEINGFEQEVQFQSKIRDVAVACGNHTVSRIVFVGQELD